MRPIGIITQLLELVATLAAAPLFVGWINQCRAWLQNRRAPSLWLPYRGIRKLFHKDAVIAENASALFRLAPYVVFSAMVVAAGIIPSRISCDDYEPTYSDAKAIIEDLFLLAEKTDRVFEAYGEELMRLGFISQSDFKQLFKSPVTDAINGNATYAIEEGIRQRIDERV